MLPDLTATKHQSQFAPRACSGPQHAPQATECHVAPITPGVSVPMGLLKATGATNSQQKTALLKLSLASCTALWSCILLLLELTYRGYLRTNTLASLAGFRTLLQGCILVKIILAASWTFCLKAAKRLMPKLDSHSCWMLMKLTAFQDLRPWSTAASVPDLLLWRPILSRERTCAEPESSSTSSSLATGLSGLKSSLHIGPGHDIRDPMSNLFPSLAAPQNCQTAQPECAP